jgi:tetratricopeptide (TPR) repeat protein
MNIRLKLLLGLLLFSTLAFGLYLLPRSVVSKGLTEKKPETISDAAPQSESLHTISPEFAEEIQKIRSEIGGNASSAGKARGYVELAGVFVKASQFDSAAYSYEQAMNLDASLQLGFETGSALFESLAFIPSASKLEENAGRARKYLESVPASDQHFAEAQAKAALTWVNSASPMKGILKLRELSESFPENRFIAFQLGLLSYQSGQYEKAVDRFKKVLSLDTRDSSSRYYLASSLLQLGKKAEALSEANTGLKQAGDMEMKASFEDLIKQIEK